MTPVEEFRLQEYQDLGPFDGNGKIRLKRCKADGRICLEKRLTLGVKKIYDILMERSVPGAPEIFLCIDDGETCIVVEKYIEGRTLSSLLENGPMELLQIVQITDCLCDTLAGLHQGNSPIVCRDLKAENVIVDGGGRPWLVDFDIARVYENGKKRDTTLLGTAEYAAPEQFGFFQTDHRTDIYALGVLINYMATGRFPVEEMAKGTIGDIVRKCTNLEPAQRYQSVDELRTDLYRLKRAMGMELEGKRNDYRPPGFRRGKRPAMALAALGYAFLAWACFSMPIAYEGMKLTGMRLWFEQAAILLSQILFIFFLFRYRGWGNNSPLLRSRNILLRAVGLILLECLLIIAASFVCMIKEMVFF